MLAVTLAVTLVAPRIAAAQGPDATLSQPSAAIGETVVLTITLVTTEDAAVEVDAAALSWGEVGVLRVRSQEVVAVADGLRHRLDVLIAPFAPGTLAFRPALRVTEGGAAVPVEMPVLTLTVPSTLAPGEPLTLSPLPPLAGVGGGQSPLLWPAVGAGALVASAAAVAGAVLGLRWLRRPPTAGEPVPEAALAPAAVLASAASLLEVDAAGAYRSIASAVRRVLGERYAFPARSLTTAELERRMEAVGVDGWEARLARELLRECDVVVYAGYRPALERRYADLTVAREIVGEAS